MCLKINFQELVGKKIGFLTVLKYIGKRPSNKYRYADWDKHRLYHKYSIKCDCGERSIVRRDFLLNKKLPKKCNYCKRINYNSTMPKTYGVWSAFRKRCRKNNLNYCTIKGIKVCERWNKFENFLEDMGEKPKYKILVRRNKSKDFCKSNCNWGTYKDSIKRHSGVNLVFINGTTRSLKGWFKYFKFTEHQYAWYVRKKGKKVSLRTKFNLKKSDRIIENYFIKQ